MENNYKRQYSLQQDTLRDNIIKGTRRIIRDMTQAQKFQKARAHIVDAIHFKHPRYDSQSLETPKLFRFLYWFQLSNCWSWLLLFCGYFYLCLTALDNQSYHQKIGLESFCLAMFWIEIVMVMYIQSFDRSFSQKRYENYFYFKLGIILLMTFDLIFFVAYPCFDSRPIRPFRILRAFVPLFYDAEYRKNMRGLASCYIDIISFMIFYWIIVVAFAVIGNKALLIDVNYKDPYQPMNVDPYKSDYLSLEKMIFITYIAGSYDVFPDNQMLAIQNYQPNYIFFIVFAFANMFLFSSIPGEFIYMKFIDTRSKILLVQEIQQQQSLILAFVTLAENESNLSIDKLVKFLLFLYRYKIRYIEYITDLCLKLDNNNNRSIQVNEFMQLSKILLQNEVMLPPNYDDIQLWVDFRKYINRKFYLKSFVKSWVFELIVSIVVALSSINAIYFLYATTPLVQIFDTIFIWIFCVQFIIRLVAIGPEVYFMDKWNCVDTFLILLGAVFFFIPNSNNIDGLIRICRIFRLASFFRAISPSNPNGFKLQFYGRLKRLFAMTLQIMPIIHRFLSMYIFFFHIFGIAGMEFFYNFYDTNGVAAYNYYEQFSNWRNYITAQYTNIAILYEAGWSTMANNHIARAPYYYAYIMLFLSLIHIIYVFILMNLIKGIFWEVYFTVDNIFIQREKETLKELKKEEENNKKTQEINEINDTIEKSQFIEPDTVIKRSIIENKFDQEIFRKLKRSFLRPMVKSKKMKKSKIAQKIINDWDIDLTELELSEEAKSQYMRRSEEEQIKLKTRRRVSINQIEEIDQADFEEEFSELLEKIIINPKVKYHDCLASPRSFVNFLRSKLIHPQELIQQTEFRMHEQPLYNQQSMHFHIYEMRAFLNIQTSKREQKAMIINSLIEECILTQQQGESLIKKRLQEKRFRVDNDGVLRKVYLADINEDLIKKFQVQFFSDLYGSSFERINKIKLQPLLKLEAGLTYTFRNILRYPQISSNQFFGMLASIEDQISNNLLHHGSLLKFVYKLDYGDVWFSLEQKRQSEMKIHFIKSGLWCYHSDMEEKEILYGRDIFNWNFPENVERKICEKYLMRFYQAFQGFALNLMDQSKFFESTPITHIYDLYTHHIDTQKTKRFKKRKIQISKIMVIVLSKEEERNDIGMKNLDYTLSDMKVQTTKVKKIDLKFEDQDDTFEHLKNFNVRDVQKIVDSEGLPFAYILNLLKEITDNMFIYSQNFIYQIEKVLNEKLDELDDKDAQPNNPTSLILQSPAKVLKI